MGGVTLQNLTARGFAAGAFRAPEHLGQLALLHARLEEAGKGEEALASLIDEYVTAPTARKRELEPTIALLIQEEQANKITLFSTSEDATRALEERLGMDNEKNPFYDSDLGICFMPDQLFTEDQTFSAGAHAYVGDPLTLSASGRKGDSDWIQKIYSNVSYSINVRENKAGALQFFQVNRHLEPFRRAFNLWCSETGVDPLQEDSQIAFVRFLLDPDLIKDCDPLDPLRLHGIGFNGDGSIRPSSVLHAIARLAFILKIYSSEATTAKFVDEAIAEDGRLDSDWHDKFRITTKHAANSTVRAQRLMAIDLFGKVLNILKELADRSLD